MKRTDTSLNIRTDDGLTNGASNVIKLIHLQLPYKPSGIIRVQFDHSDIGKRTKIENRHLYVQGIDPGWTPIKPVTAQFTVGANRTIQVVWKQFPLGAAATKTIHRSQGSTETKIVVNFDTKKAIHHIHYIGLSRVTAREGFYITKLCEDKTAVGHDVQKEIHCLRTEANLNLCLIAIYNTDQIALKVCYLNARSLHWHIEDIQNDLNYLSTVVSIFFRDKIQSFR